MSATTAPGSGQKARVALRVMEAVGAGKRVFVAVS